MKETLIVRKNQGAEDQQHAVTIPPGCILICKAIDADSGKPLSGVSFWTGVDDKPGARTGLNSSPINVDHPVSNENGELRAVVLPGVRQYGVGLSKMPEGYSGSPAGREVTCESGKTVELTFELRKGK